MKTGMKIFLGILGVAATVGAILLLRRGGTANKNPYAPSVEYDVENIYKLPDGVVPLDVATIPEDMVDAVRWKHRYFELHEAYMDDMNQVYLVELHEGFNPVVFLVAPKELA